MINAERDHFDIRYSAFGVQHSFCNRSRSHAMNTREHHEHLVVSNLLKAKPVCIEARVTQANASLRIYTIIEN